jgi:hypothetical protein
LAHMYANQNRTEGLIYGKVLRETEDLAMGGEE